VLESDTLITADDLQSHRERSDPFRLSSLAHQLLDKVMASV